MLNCNFNTPGSFVMKYYCKTNREEFHIRLTGENQSEEISHFVPWLCAPVVLFIQALVGLQSISQYTLGYRVCSPDLCIISDLNMHNSRSC